VVVVGGVVVVGAADRSTTSAAGTDTGGDVVGGGTVGGGDVVVGATGAAAADVGAALVWEASFQAGTGPPPDPERGWEPDDRAPGVGADAEPPGGTAPPLGAADAVESF
jgi:hypothetical protein